MLDPGFHTFFVTKKIAYLLPALLSLFRLEDPNPVVESLYRIQNSYVV